MFYDDIMLYVILILCHKMTNISRQKLVIPRAIILRKGLVNRRCACVACATYENNILFNSPGPIIIHII